MTAKTARCAQLRLRAPSANGSATFPMCYGSEFTSNAILAWADQNRVEWHYIAPGKPMQNGFVESFMYGRPLRCKACGEVLAAHGSGAFMYTAY
jgi:transposase InsO family protein